MKKVSIFIITLCLILSMVGCSKGTKEVINTQNYINSVINDISENIINVTPVDNDNVNSNKNLIEAKSIIIDLNTASTDVIPKLSKNDKIRIVYNGDSIKENPFKIDKVFSIYLVDENGEVIPNK